METNGTAIEVRGHSTPALVPANVGEAMQLAEMMSTSKLLPTHFHGKPADAFLVVEQSMRWGLSPFAVAQCTSVIQGKLMFEGKLVAAVVNARGGLADKLSFAFSGEGDSRTVRVSGRLRGEADARTVDVRLKDARTSNQLWAKQPDQQLVYHGSRVWARRHAPELMLGISCPEEMEPAPEGGAQAEPPLVIEEMTGTIESVKAGKDPSGSVVYVVTIAGQRLLTRDLATATEAKKLSKEAVEVCATASAQGGKLRLLSLSPQPKAPTTETATAEPRDVASSHGPETAPLPFGAEA